MLQSPPDVLWVLVCAAQVMLMQAGFCLLESGMARAKNSINVAIKNLVDFCIAGVMFWVVGFGLMFGRSWISSSGMTGWFGSDRFLIDETASSSLLTFFLFQAMFCGTATTIISGAVAERIRFRSYVAISILVSGLIYPVFGHWAWGGVFSEGGAAEPSGWLAEIGFIDFAGSTVVHSVGAWVALSAIFIVGPRMGRFGQRRRLIQSSHLSSVVLGVLLLWFGWFGFNGGSTLGLGDEVPLILVNTFVASSTAGLASLIIARAVHGRPDVASVGNGVLGGLVAVTACCHMISPLSASVIGICSAGMVQVGTYYLERYRLDDVIGAIPVHGICGVWGTLSVAFFGDPSMWLAGNGFWEQLSVQLLGCVVALAWAGGVSFVVLLAWNACVRLRVRPRDEYLGLNIAEHEASTELVDLLTQMQRHRSGLDVGKRIRYDPFTEVGQIATQYNRVIDQVHREVACRREAEQQFRDIYNHAIEGIFQIAPDGTFLNVNPALLKLLGYEDLDHLNAVNADPDRCVDCDPEAFQALLRQIDREGRVSGIRSRIRRADGAEVWVNENIRAVRDEDGAVLYYEGTMFDATEQIEAERLQLEIQRVEASTQAKSEFLASMSHEMRTPLNGILSMLDFMEEIDDEEQRLRYLEIARRSSKQLLETINDVLDLSKIEAGCIQLEYEAMDLQQWISETVESLTPYARQQDVELHLRTDPDVPQQWQGDPVRMRQVVVNLLGNAIKFSQGGDVTIALSWDSSETNHQLRVEVADSGIGIEADRLKHIFEPFTQADASTTRRFGGTGLGLSISRQLVEQMDGEMGVESRVGEGSTFWFTLQQRQSSDTERARGTDEANAFESVPTSLVPFGKQRKILVVDDNEINRLVAEEHLRRLDFSTHAVDSGETALRTLRQESFDAVLMDCEMPSMDGFETTRNVLKLHRAGALAIPPGQPLVIIALTAQLAPETLDRCLQAGMLDRLSKPIQPAEFQRVLKEQLDGVRPDRTDSSPARPPLEQTPAHPAEQPADESIANAPIDWSELTARCGNSEEMTRQLLDVFRTQLPDQVSQLSAHVDQGDFEAAAQVAHAIKGSAGNMAAGGVATVAASLENHFRTQTPSDQNHSVESLTTQMTACLDWIDHQLHQLQTADEDPVVQANSTSELPE